MTLVGGLAAVVIVIWLIQRIGFEVDHIQGIFHRPNVSHQAGPSPWSIIRRALMAVAVLTALVAGFIFSLEVRSLMLQVIILALRTSADMLDAGAGLLFEFVPLDAIPVFVALSGLLTRG